MNMKAKPIIIVQGAQWGSEAKGMVAANLCLSRKINYAVRTGAVNAGHTVYWEGKAVKMQQLPTGWVNPGTKLVLGAGSFISPEILAQEIRMVSELTGEDVRERLLIDHRCSLHLPEHQQQAKLEGRHHAIGATGKGCSVAITDKIRYRGRGYKLFHDWLGSPTVAKHGEDAPLWGRLRFTDTVKVLHDAYDSGEQILLEGTQGSLLDLHLGPYPYTTHKQTQAAQWAIEAGLGLRMEYEICMVARTYPIRVAGNSGPMAKETTWPNIARDINRRLMIREMPQLVKSHALQVYENYMHGTAMAGTYALPKYYDGSPNYDFHTWRDNERLQYQVALSEMPSAVFRSLPSDVQSELEHLFEMTTVTKKIRRVAQWHGPDVAWSCRVNRGSYIVLTFFNYWHPETWGRTDFGWSDEYERSLYQVEKDAGIPVKYITTGPETSSMINVVPIRKQHNS
jgi:adenylosuccinate synthase